MIAFLERAGTSDVVDGPLSLDIAGPDTVTYAQLVERIRDALLLGRPRVDLPVTMTAVGSRVAAAITGEDPGLVGPLMGSLTADLLPRDDRAAELLRRAPAPLRRRDRARPARVGDRRGAGRAGSVPRS